MVIFEKDFKEWVKRLEDDGEIPKLAIELGVIFAAGGGDRDRTNVERMSELLALAAFRGYQLARGVGAAEGSARN